MFIIWKSTFTQKVTVNELTSNFPFIHNQKKTACASKGDELVLATLRYAVLEHFYAILEQGVLLTGTL